MSTSSYIRAIGDADYNFAYNDFTFEFFVKPTIFNIQNIYTEIPNGTIDGTNRVFTLVNIPNPSISLKLFYNGLILQQGGTLDYTVYGNSIVLNFAPSSDSILVANYRTVNIPTASDAVTP